MKIKEQDSRQLIYQSYFGFKKVFVDKENKKIILENRYLFFIHRQREIPFADVTSVLVDYKPPNYANGQESPAKWELSLDIGDEKVAIDYSVREWEMWSLGQRISELTGKKMVDRRGKSETKYDPERTREEIVNRWKRRYEEDN